MIPESLDTTLVNVLWSQDEARLFKALKKQPVKSPVHQWTKRTGVGDEDGAWVPEGGESTEADQELERQWTVMKYLQTKRQATLQATLSNMIEPALVSEKISGTLWIVKQIEKILFYGDSSMVAEEPNGFMPLITTNILDMRGKAASNSDMEDRIQEGCLLIRDNYGLATDLYTSLRTMADFQKLIQDRYRFPIEPGTSNKGRSASMVIDKYATPFGEPLLTSDLFITEGGVPRASVITTKRPSQPSISATRQPVTGGNTSYFVAGDVGSYYYRLEAVNRYGASQVSAADQVTGILADDQVDIAITDGATAGTCYNVYRSKKNAANGDDCRFAYRIARTGASPTIQDYNAELPGCSSAFLLNLSPLYAAVEWEQFLPLMKFDLYPTNAAVYPFLMLLFGALGLKKEEQMCRIRNIAPSALGWF